VELRYQAAYYVLGWRCCHEETGGEADRDEQQQAGDDAFEQLLAPSVLDPQQQQRHQPGDRPAEQQWQPEQEVQSDRTADHLGHVGGHRHGLGLHPIGQPGRAAQLSSDRFGQRAPGHQPELGRQVLHETGHRIRDDDDPQQRETELCAGADVCGDVARVDVGDGGDECGAK
jgi:hypothetical protein